MKIIDQIHPCEMPGQVLGIWQLQAQLQAQATNPQWTAIAPATAQALINEELLSA